jgi:hypothetical protein
VPDAEIDMEYNWPLFDGAHVLIRPKGMTVDQLQEGYYRFLREAYSMTGILRRFRGAAWELPAAASHFARNYLISRYGMLKTAHAIRRKGTDGVGMDDVVRETVRSERPRKPAAASPRPVVAPPREIEPA